MHILPCCCHLLLPLPSNVCHCHLPLLFAVAVAVCRCRCHCRLLLQFAIAIFRLPPAILLHLMQFLRPAITHWQRAARPVPRLLQEAHQHAERLQAITAGHGDVLVTGACNVPQ